jgi:hypothetical protein
MKAISWPETPKARLCVLAILGFVGLAGLVITACASVNRNPATVVSAYADDFNSGSPGAKNLWETIAAGGWIAAPAKAGGSGNGSRGEETTARFGKNGRAKPVT